MSKTFFFNTEQLYRFRVVNHLSMDDMAALLGISRLSYSRIENGTSDPSFDSLANIAYLYSVDGSVEFERLFNHIPFDGAFNIKYFLPSLIDRRTT